MNSINPNEVSLEVMALPHDENPNNALVQAAADGDLPTLQRLRADHPDLDLDAMDEQGRTALSAAVGQGHPIPVTPF